MQTTILETLLDATWQSPVFGDSFSPQVNTKRSDVLAQMQAINRTFSAQLNTYLRAGMPGAAAEEVRKIVQQIAPKTVSFCPALVAGELDDTPRLSAAAVAIGLMYWGDQTMDRGDTTMPLAIQKFSNQPVEVPTDKQAIVDAQVGALHAITHHINQLATPDDAPYVLACFREQVLANEVKMHALSQEYLQATDKPAFIAQNAKELARAMVIDAGFPSVSSTLYAIYRQHDPTLPSLSDIYADQTMVNLLQICNAVVRLADELGDWEMDAGQHKDWGIFTINLFNQAEPQLIQNFCGSALLPMSPQIQTAFTQFANDRKQHGDFLMQCFFDHARDYIKNLPPETTQRFGLYITLCKRVLEIGYVNRIGDIALSNKE